MNTIHARHGREQAKDIFFRGVDLPLLMGSVKRKGCSIIMFIIGDRAQCKDENISVI